jgi:uncharacterized FlaG/YvyC family protein
MDIGGIKQAPAAAVPVAANRVEPTSNGTRGVATELDRTQAVREVKDTESVRVDIRDERAAQQLARDKLLNDFIRSRATTDPRSREVVFQKVNTRTGEVVKQFPEEAILKLREYLDTQRGRDDGGRDGDRRVTRIA